MKRNFLLLTVLTIVLLPACLLFSGKVKVVSINSGETVELYQNLSVKLNQDICPEERLNEWDTLKYFAIDPPVFGRFLWTNKNELTFSPSMGFAPATEYSIKLNPDAFAALSGKLFVSDAVMKFSTAPLDIESVHCFWNMYNGKKIIQFSVTFNYEIHLPSFLDFLNVTIDNKNYDAEIFRKTPIWNTKKTIVLQYDVGSWRQVQ
jgi:hypothetical protein